MRQAMNDKAAITPSQATPGRPVWVPLPSTGAWVRGLIDGLKWDEGTSGYVACVRIAALGIGRLYFSKRVTNRPPRLPSWLESATDG